MAGVGRPLKPPEQRRNRTAPLRGEWVDLKPLEQPVLPPADRRWGANARRGWRAWRRDPVTTQWGPADVFAAQELARLYDELSASDQWRRMCELGLTPKGKRDLRWRTPGEVKTIAEQQAPVKRLRVVEQQPPQGETG